MSVAGRVVAAIFVVQARSLILDGLIRLQKKKLRLVSYPTAAAGQLPRKRQGGTPPSTYQLCFSVVPELIITSPIVTATLFMIISAAVKLPEARACYVACYSVAVIALPHLFISILTLKLNLHFIPMKKYIMNDRMDMHTSRARSTPLQKLSG